MKRTRTDSRNARALGLLLLAASVGLWGCPHGGGAGPADLGVSTGDLGDLAGAAWDLARDLPPSPDLPASACTSERACRGGELCLAPGEPRGCGVCRRPDPMEVCQSDAECKARGASLICVPGTCVCNGERVCVVGCLAQADCPEGTYCAAGNRCAPRPCALPDDCPRDFRCAIPDGGGRCERRACALSSDCPSFCVKGQCYSAPGTCSLPAP